MWRKLFLLAAGFSAACIYPVGQVSRTDDPTMQQILRNIFSDMTLDWLCLRE